ncbi:hypothetical protein SAMN05444746_111178 [Variovorax sp. OK212]|nr:hypothetical protein SAMN05518853_111178 [Variovorax sp. OK202]SFD82957.1 hypothetical protein SAMN05444746_111178 [Variovorax sp. OK212]
MGPAIVWRRGQSRACRLAVTAIAGSGGVEGAASEKVGGKVGGKAGRKGCLRRQQFSDHRGSFQMTAPTE